MTCFLGYSLSLCVIDFFCYFETLPDSLPVILEEDEVIMINGENIRDTGIAVDYVFGILDCKLFIQHSF